MEIKDFSRTNDLLEVPDLVEIQTKPYERFLQKDASPKKRKNEGLEAILREIFPIYNFDRTMSLEYIKYALGKPRYTLDECRKLRLTYGMPFRVWLRLNKKEPVEEEVYLGEIPIMLGGGVFIINGAERVIVSQLHRSPGVDFLEEIGAAEKKLHSCRIIPERGSWIEINVSPKDVLTVRIDQSSKIPATCLLRAFDEKYSTDVDIIRAFYKTRRIRLSSPDAYSQIKGKYLVGEVVDKKSGEILIESGTEITENIIKIIRSSDLKAIEIVEEVADPLILNTLAEDKSTSHEEALEDIYAKLRPGNPKNLAKAKTLFQEKFSDVNRYRLGRVGRFRLNRKFGQNIPESEMTLRPEDFVNAVKYIIKLRNKEGAVDDIDHLGNRRVRTIDELATEEIRKGFLKIRRVVQERMSMRQPEELTPRSLVNSKTLSSAVNFFFGRGELSQVVDQTNPLAQLTHQRRLSALGPGGLNRKRAGFEVRDVHISHYGRICPIETPEGTNIGLISSLGIYSMVDQYGFLITPYAVVKNGRVQKKIIYLRADEEINKWIAPPDVEVDASGKIKHATILARYNGEFKKVDARKIEYMDVSSKQMVGVSASLIPFLEHNDANRALMGSNMQRQAVPLLINEPPVVKTGMESTVARNSGMVVTARSSGKVKYVDAHRIEIDDDVYELRKFVGLTERTCLNQRPIVKVGDRVKRGQVIADGASTSQGELSLGRTVLVGFMAWDGYNFEDAILISENLVKDDRFTSIHIEEFEVEIRETKLGREEFTRDIPNVSERALRNLNEDGIVRIGTRVGPGDILVGKVSPKSKSELTPEEKLLHAIFGRAGEDVKNDSLEVPSGLEGIVIDAQKFSRRSYLSEEERKKSESEVRKAEKDFNAKIAKLIKKMFSALEKVAGRKRLVDGKNNPLYGKLDGAKDAEVIEMEESFDVDEVALKKSVDKKEFRSVYQSYSSKIEDLKDERDRQLEQLRRGDELPSGVLEMVKVYVATKRTLSVGDKMAGRHGNKGVIAKILPQEDMPFLEDGTPVEVLLNPLGVPSRMNVGQILETHLGWAAKLLGFEAVSPVFQGATEEQIHELLKEAGLPEDGKVTLYDGRTGQPFDQKVVVGYIYMMKLHHLVDDKVHARATGPYSLITQQPLGGKARFGGQRFGEMEVWALEAYGAAHILQELLTVKSDDVEGRTKIYESMVKGNNVLEAGTPLSFEVLTNEIKGLALNMQLEKRQAL